jgi:hypothetical protein
LDGTNNIEKERLIECGMFCDYFLLLNYTLKGEMVSRQSKNKGCEGKWNWQTKKVWETSDWVTNNKRQEEKEVLSSSSHKNEHISTET